MKKKNENKSIDIEMIEKLNKKLTRFDEIENMKKQAKKIVRSKSVEIEREEDMRSTTSS